MYYAMFDFGTGLVESCRVREKSVLSKHKNCILNVLTDSKALKFV